jgi:hypothetical protein
MVKLKKYLKFLPSNFRRKNESDINTTPASSFPLKQE